MATSPGSYKGVTINAGTDAEVAAQIAKIDAGASGGSPNTPTPTPTSSNGSESSSDAFISALQKKLIGQSDMISSTNTELESNINKAIKGVRQGQGASAARIESQYGREIAFQSGQNQQAIGGFLEERRGFATSMVALRNLVETSDKNINDLEQRKQELILQGESEAASQISTLQLKEMEFRQQAQQQTFNNLLALGNFQMGVAQESRLAKAQSFTEKSAMAEIALQYGVEQRSGDTIDTIVARAAPFASEAQKLKLEEMRANIRRINADTARAMDTGETSDPIIIDAMAHAFLNGDTAFLGNIKDPKTSAQVYARIEELRKPREWSSDELATEANNFVRGGVNYPDAKANIAADPTIVNKTDAYAALDSAYNRNTGGGLGLDFSSMFGGNLDTRGTRYTEIGREISRLEKIGTYASKQKIEQLKRERASL